MGRAELGNGTTGDRHGEGLAGLGPTEHLADVVTQLFLCDVAHADQRSRTATLPRVSAQRSGFRHPQVGAGCLVATVGIFALSRADATSPFVLTAIGYVLAGAGFGVIVPGVTHVAMRDVPTGVSGAASGIVNASRQLGTSLGLAVLGSIGVTAATSHWQTAIHRFPATIRAAATGQTQNVAGAHIGAVTQALGRAYRHAAVGSFVHGYHLAVSIAAAFVLAAATAALIGFRRPTANTTTACQKHTERPVEAGQRVQSCRLDPVSAEMPGDRQRPPSANVVDDLCLLMRSRFIRSAGGRGTMLR